MNLYRTPRLTRDGLAADVWMGSVCQGVVGEEIEKF